jgi:hypothetical protein
MRSWGGIFWKGGVGYVTRDMLAAHMPAASLGSDALVMVCGPPGIYVEGRHAQCLAVGSQLMQCRLDFAHWPVRRIDGVYSIA